MNPCPKAEMREIRLSGLMSGIWKRGSALPRQISTLPNRPRPMVGLVPTPPSPRRGQKLLAQSRLAVKTIGCSEA